jgi:hypothetical protein
LKMSTLSEPSRQPPAGARCHPQGLRWQPTGVRLGCNSWS